MGTRYWQRRTAAWAVAGAAAGVVLALVAWQVFHPGREFDPAVWRDGDPADEYARHRMADRLVAHRTLVGRTRAEVVAMLGEPLPPRAWDDPGDLTYHLGRERDFLSIDSEWMTVRVGADRRAVRAWVWRD